MTRADLVNLIAHAEGYRRNVYKCPAGYWTVGFGRNLESVGVSRGEASILLNNDIDNAIDSIHANFNWVDDLDNTRYYALVEMCFNLGITRLKGFRKMLAAMAIRDWDAAADEALDSKWATQVGQRAVRIAEMIRKGDAMTW